MRLYLDLDFLFLVHVSRTYATVVPMPMYALYLIKIIRQGRGDNTLTTPVAIFYIVSFMVPFVWFLMYAWSTTFNAR